MHAVPSLAGSCQECSLVPSLPSLPPLRVALVPFYLLSALCRPRRAADLTPLLFPTPRSSLTFPSPERMLVASLSRYATYFFCNSWLHNAFQAHGERFTVRDDFRSLTPLNRSKSHPLPQNPLLTHLLRYNATFSSSLTRPPRLLRTSERSAPVRDLLP